MGIFLRMGVLVYVMCAEIMYGNVRMGVPVCVYIENLCMGVWIFENVPGGYLSVYCLLSVMCPTVRSCRRSVPWRHWRMLVRMRFTSWGACQEATWPVAPPTPNRLHPLPETDASTAWYYVYIYYA